MCLEFLFNRKHYKKLPDVYIRPFDCSCDICGSVFENIQGLINHSGYHTTEEINSCINRGYGTVRCSTCWETFRTISDMERHSCAQRKGGIIDGLSPIMSRSNSLDSVIVHEDSPV
jgi:ribosomal protein L34E